MSSQSQGQQSSLKMKLGPGSDYNLRLAPNRATMTIQGWERFQKSQGQINRKFLAEAKLSLEAGRSGVSGFA